MRKEFEFIWESKFRDHNIWIKDIDVFRTKKEAQEHFKIYKFFRPVKNTKRIRNDKKNGVYVWQWEERFSGSSWERYSDPAMLADILNMSASACHNSGAHLSEISDDKLPF